METEELDDGAATARMLEKGEEERPEEAVGEELAVGETRGRAPSRVRDVVVEVEDAEDAEEEEEELLEVLLDEEEEGNSAEKNGSKIEGSFVFEESSSWGAFRPLQLANERSH